MKNMMERKILLMTESKRFALIKGYLLRRKFIFLLAFYSFCFLVSFLVALFLDMKYKEHLRLELDREFLLKFVRT